MIKLKKPAADLPFAAYEMAAEIGHWLIHLGAERRMSPKTVDSYRRDVHQFLGFLAGHFGCRVTLAALRDLAPQDVRAFMAHRRGQAVCGRSLMRSLAGIRSFARFLERQGNGKVAALAAVLPGKRLRRVTCACSMSQRGCSWSEASKAHPLMRLLRRRA